MMKNATQVEFTFKEENRRRNRLLTRQMFSNPSLVFGLIVLTILIIIVLFGSSWGSYDPYLVAQSARPYYDTEKKEMIAPPFEPSEEYPIGTDQWGNDLLSLILYGARMTLVAGGYITLVRVFLGGFLGILAGWWEGRFIDRFIKSLSDLISSVPVLLSALIIIYALNISNGLWVFLVALSLVGWTETAQLIRSEVMRIRQKEYIEAAQAIGMTRLEIIVRHVLPNILPYLLVITALEMSAVLLLLAELGFLGTYIGGTSLYIPDVMSSEVFHLAEMPEWGALIAQSAPFIRSAPFIILAPGLAFFIAIVGLNALGEGMRWLFDRFPMSMSLLLHKRTLIFFITFIALSAYIISFTGPKTSYLRVAKSFDVDRAQAHVNALEEIRTQSVDSATEIELYVENAFKELEIGGGWKSHSFIADYHYSDYIHFTDFLSEPMLSYKMPNGESSQKLVFGEDFNIVESKELGSGKVTGKLVFIRHTYVGEEGILASQDLEGKIVIVSERMISSKLAERVALLGARAVLIVMNPNTDLITQETLLIPARSDSDASPPIPVFRITAEVTDRMLAAEGLSYDSFWEPGWDVKILETEISLELSIHKNAAVQTHSTVGFLGGYDANLAQEMVVLFTTYDSQVDIPQNFAGTAMMLEMARTWHENNLDPRRAILFVAWDSASLDAPGASAFIGNPENFKKLTGLASAVPAPMMVWQLDLPNYVDDETLYIHAASDESLRELLLDSAKLTNSPLQLETLLLAQSSEFDSTNILSLELPALALTSYGGDSIAEEATFRAAMQSYGESISYNILNILRKPKY